MAICKGCQSELTEGARFCSVCGKPVEVEATPAAEAVNESETFGYSQPAQSVYQEAEQAYQQTPVYNTSAYASGTAETTTKAQQQECLDNMYARLKNERLCWRIFGIVWSVLCGIFIIAGFAEPILLVYAVLYAPLAVINFLMIGKVNRYIDTLYTDCGPAVERCNSIGMIVFCYFFNTIAMIFFIINFVSVKSNKQTFADIKRNQDAYNSSRF